MRVNGETLLGWKILKQSNYKINLPILSKEEEELILALEELFKDETRRKSIKTNEDAEKLLKELIFSYAEEHKIYLDRSQTEYLTKVAALYIYGFGFLEYLLKDKRIEEISVIGIDKPVYIYLRENGWQSVNAMFTSERAIVDIINKMAQKIGRRITLQNPRLDAVLPDGSRLHASISPISNGEVSIRKFREIPFAPCELVYNNTISKKAIALLSVAMHGDNSILISGNTASGKTTTLNTLFSFVPANERIVITEETPEINIPHTHQIRLVANRDMEISLKDLVYDSLRMRPDRIIVGEVRNPDETKALFDVLLAGQARGAYATFHAQSSQEAFQRLRSFGIMENDLNSIDFIVIQKRMMNYDPKNRTCKELRKITEIGGKFGLIYSYNGKCSLFHKRGLCMAVENLANDLNLSVKELKHELYERESLITMKNDFATAFKNIQKKLFGIQYEHS